VKQTGASGKTQANQDSPRSCWDYSPEELRAMPHEQASKIFRLQMKENVRVAREKAEAEKEAGR